MEHRSRETGLFITFEGPEGSGKSTQAAALAARLRDHGRPVHLFAEPGGTRISQAVREILLADENTEMAPRSEVLLFLAARAQLVGQRIRPALEAGETVVCDRYTDSTLAYQSVSAGLPVAALEALNDFATEGLIPDRTLLLDIAAETGLQRQSQWNRMEARGRGFHDRVRRAYLELAERWPERICVIQAAMAPDQVESAIWAAIEPLLARPLSPRADRSRL